MKKALIIVDYQYDFCDPNGTLYVPNADKLISKINELIDFYKSNNDLVIASKDWHPQNHYSFNKWPIHCVQNTIGSQLYNLNENKIDKIILKGADPNLESYSAFYDEQNNSNGLHEYLQSNNVKEVMIVGVALDVCVSATLKDAIKLGYQGNLDLDYCAGNENKIVF